MAPHEQWTTEGAACDECGTEGLTVTQAQFMLGLHRHPDFRPCQRRLVLLAYLRGEG
jgi:hypothetical protein